MKSKKNIVEKSESRRDFFKKSLAGAAGFAVAASTPRLIHGEVQATSVNGSNLNEHIFNAQGEMAGEPGLNSVIPACYQR